MMAEVRLPVMCGSGCFSRFDCVFRTVWLRDGSTEVVLWCVVLESVVLESVVVRGAVMRCVALWRVVFVT